MRTRIEMVVSRLDGTEEPADVLVCPSCGGEEFTIYVLHRGRHQHLQCTTCQESFCDGSCTEKEVTSGDR